MDNRSLLILINLVEKLLVHQIWLHFVIRVNWLDIVMKIVNLEDSVFLIINVYAVQLKMIHQEQNV
jgi:hypothetical protein